MKVGPARIGGNLSHSQNTRRKPKKRKRKDVDVLSYLASSRPEAASASRPRNSDTQQTPKGGSWGSSSCHRYRDCHDLYVCEATYQCATRDHCVPCAYKIGTFDVSLDKEFTTLVPNSRPESCPRCPSTDCNSVGIDGTLGFRSGMDVLTVGDGDFSFSLAIARIVARQGCDRDEKSPKQHETNLLVATSYESRDTIMQVYPGACDTIDELESLGVCVCYEVDATRLVETLPAELSRKSPCFHRIVWNFPCTAAPSGQDGQNDEMDNNKNLIRSFVRNAAELLVRDGEIHMAHKTKPPFNQWNMEEVALEGVTDDCKESAEEGFQQKPRFVFRGRIVLDRCCIPPYVPRKALDKKSFSCHDACVYVFGLEQEGPHDESTTFLPTILLDSNSRKIGIETNLAALLPVDEKMLSKLRSNFLASSYSYKPSTGRKKHRK